MKEVYLVIKAIFLFVFIGAGLYSLAILALDGMSVEPGPGSIFFSFGISVLISALITLTPLVLFLDGPVKKV